MKPARHILLSLLLFAFGFFVVHDYVIADVDADTQYELCETEMSAKALDLPSQIHEHIHILLSVPENELRLPEEAPHDEQLHSESETPPSHITSIPTRPPLA